MAKNGTFIIHSAISGARVRREFLLECARHAAKKIRRPIAFINFIVVNDREMSKLHRTFMNLRGTTDVMSFDLADSARNPVEGEIYICLDQARRQAAFYRVPLYLEIARLAVHGVLHLAGECDDTPQQRETMHRLEDRTLQAVKGSYDR